MLKSEFAKKKSLSLKLEKVGIGHPPAQTPMSEHEDSLKKDDGLKNDDDIKIQDNLKNQDNLKSQDNLKNKAK